MIVSFSSPNLTAAFGGHNSTPAFLQRAVFLRFFQPRQLSSHGSRQAESSRSPVSCMPNAQIARSDTKPLYPPKPTLSSAKRRTCPLASRDCLLVAPGYTNHALCSKRTKSRSIIHPGSETSQPISTRPSQNTPQRRSVGDDQPREHLQGEDC